MTRPGLHPAAVPAKLGAMTGCPCGCKSRPRSYTDPECVTQRPIHAESEERPSDHWPCEAGPCVCSVIAAVV